MTIDKVIQYHNEVADEQSRLYSLCPCPCDGTKNCMSLKNGKDMGCVKCAAEHRQLAAWLQELKEAKRLLKAAVEDFETIESNLEYDEHCVIKTHSIRCDECPLSAVTIYRCKWRHADEVKKLIGDEPSGI